MATQGHSQGVAQETLVMVLGCFPMLMSCELVVTMNHEGSPIFVGYSTPGNNSDSGLQAFSYDIVSTMGWVQRWAGL